MGATIRVLGGALAFIAARALAAAALSYAVVALPADLSARILPSTLVLTDVSLIVSGIVAGAAALRGLHLLATVRATLLCVAAAVCGFALPVLLVVALTAQSPANPGRTAVRLGLAVAGALACGLLSGSGPGRAALAGFAWTFAILALLMPVATTVAVGNEALRAPSELARVAERLRVFLYAAAASSAFAGAVLAARSIRNDGLTRRPAAVGSIAGPLALLGAIALASLLSPFGGLHYDLTAGAFMVGGALAGGLTAPRQDAAAQAWDRAAQ